MAVTEKDIQTRREADTAGFPSLSIQEYRAMMALFEMDEIEPDAF